MNPLERYAQVKTAAAEERRNKELQLWHTWDASGRESTHLVPLVQSFGPLITQAVKKYKAPGVDETAFRADALNSTIKALETFDPNRGVAVGTHVVNYLQRGYRFNAQQQNITKIPAGRAPDVGKAQRMAAELEESLGRPPTMVEIRDAMGMTPRRFGPIQSALRRDVFASRFDGIDPTPQQISRDDEVEDILLHELTGRELEVLQHTTGKGKQKITDTVALARRLNTSPSTISRVRKAIAEKARTLR